MSQYQKKHSSTHTYPDINHPLSASSISSPNHCLLCAEHAHSIAASFAVVPKLYHLIPVSVNSLLGTLSVNLMPHIYLTFLICPTIQMQC